MKFLIMAGGSGERFWPLSKKEHPKQFLKLFSEHSMIRETVNRILNYAEPKDIYIATNEVQLKFVKSELKDIPEKNIIIEPEFKDTAAAIVYGGLIITRNSLKDEIICVLASDHLIEELDKFILSLEKAKEEAKKGNIITLGIIPTKPLTSYGYIKLKNIDMYKTSKALQFTEKPNNLKAKEYFNTGNYVWNSGMFIFKYSSLIAETKKYLPKHDKIINSMKNHLKNYSGIKLSKIISPHFKKFEKISIDFSIMEKSNILYCIPVDFGWNDIGSFNSLEEILEKNKNNNVIKNAKYIQIDSKNNIIISDKKERLITSVGLSNMIVVDTEDALMICDKDNSSKIKLLLKKIERDESE